MPKFTDAAGRTWIVRVTPRTMRDVRDFCGTNLGTSLQQDMKGLADILDDPVKLASVMWALCQHQARQDDVSIDDFLDSIVGDAMGGAGQALSEGLLETFPQQQTLQLRMALMLKECHQRTWKSRIDSCLRTLTGMHGPSRLQRAWASIRGILPERIWAS